jgi:outer membrane murein-binding lipoprotein Lpp
MADPITIKGLPPISEINTGDLLIVQTAEKTGALKFEDFIVGEEHISFYKNIEDLSARVDLLEGSIEPYIADIATITSLKTDTTTIQGQLTPINTDLNSLKTRVQTLESSLVKLKSDAETAAEANTAALAMINSRLDAIEVSSHEH